MNGLKILKREQGTMKERLACQKTTPAVSERIGESFVTWTAFEKSATEKKCLKSMAIIKNKIKSYQV
jgi:hypothetical protein